MILFGTILSKWTQSNNLKIICQVSVGPKTDLIEIAETLHLQRLEKIRRRQKERKQQKKFDRYLSARRTSKSEDRASQGFTWHSCPDSDSDSDSDNDSDSDSDEEIEEVNKELSTICEALILILFVVILSACMA